MSPAGVNIYDMTCPFCGTPDFDDIGLKDHLSGGDCAAFEKVPTVNQFREQQARDRQRSKEATAMAKSFLASMNKPEFFRLNEEISQELGIGDVVGTVKE